MYTNQSSDRAESTSLNPQQDVKKVITLADALIEYRNSVGEQEVANIRSIIKKHFLVGLLPNLELPAQAALPGLSIFNEIPISGFIDSAQPLFLIHLQQLSNVKTLRVRKSQWKRFCEWLQNQKWYSSVLPVVEISKNNIDTFKHLPEGIQKPKSSPIDLLRYGLKDDELTLELRQQIDNFDKFCRTITDHRILSNRDVTQKEYRWRIYLFLGWRKNIQNISVEKLNLADIGEVELVKQYVKWQRDRGMSSNTILTYTRVAVTVCEFLYGYASEQSMFRDIKKVTEMRTYTNGIPDRKDRPRTSDEAFAERELSMDQCLDLVRYLGWRCKDLERHHGLVSQVIDSWMDYFIIALLVTTGIRQREVRELSMSRLVQDEDGFYSVKLKPNDHKTGSKTGRGRGYPLFVGPLREQLTQDFIYYIHDIRPKNLDHDCLFFIRHHSTCKSGEVRLRGDLITHEGNFNRLVPDLIYRLTGHLYGYDNAKKTTCHDFRRITATWVCTYGDPKYFPMYAEMLGHDVILLQKLYAKIHPGSLAAQIKDVYSEIAANEARAKSRNFESSVRETSQLNVISATQACPSEQLELAVSLAKLMWGFFSESKRSKILKTLTPQQQRLLGLA